MLGGPVRAITATKADSNSTALEASPSYPNFVWDSIAMIAGAHFVLKFAARVDAGAEVDMVAVWWHAALCNRGHKTNEDGSTYRWYRQHVDSVVGTKPGYWRASRDTKYY